MLGPQRGRFLSTPRRRLVSSAFLLLGSYLLVDGVVMPLYVRHGQELLVPNVVELPFEEAQHLLQDHGLRVVREDRVDPAMEPGRVTAQLPLANALVKTGRRIYLAVSQPARPVSVPRLEGSQREAEFSLSNAQLRLGTVTYGVSNYYPEGAVMNQSPPPPVNVTISFGRATLEPIVPKIVDNDIQTAEREILRSGLRLGLIDTVVMPNLLPNTVLLQSAEPGSVLPAGDAVDVLITALSGHNVLRSASLQRQLDSLRYAPPAGEGAAP